MKIKLDKPSLLSRAVELISELVTEVRIKVNEFGISISAMDPANVAMVGFKIPKSSFVHYEAGAEVLGVNLESLKKILKRAGPRSILVMESKESFLSIVIEDRVKRSFQLSLIDIESEDFDFDVKSGRMEFVARIVVPSQDFIDSIEDCSIVADACSFSIREGKFIIEAKGLNSASSEFSGDEAAIDGENARAKYSLEYLQKFAKGAKLCEKTFVRFSDDHPLKLDFRLPDMELSFVLAPRVETED